MTQKPAKTVTSVATELDEEDKRDLANPRIQANIKASRAEHRAGKSRPAKELQEELDTIAREALEKEQAATR